jgi:adenylate cyclase
MMPGMQDSPGSLTQAELEREADVPTEYVHELVEAGILRPAAPGAFAVADISRVRLARALLDGGVSTDDLRWAIESMGLPIDQVADTFTPPSRSDHTFGELMAALGARGENLPSVYAAFGLAVPPIDAPVPADEERLVTRFLDVWATVDEAPDVAVRAAHIIGDGMRRITAGTLDLFDEHGGSPPDRLRRGMSREASMEPSFALPVVQKELLAWLDTRHTEHEVFERIVDHTERVVSREGRAAPRSHEQPAIAFVDLAGYTELTATRGDERAAEFATTLGVLASRIVSAHDGRVVKQLGDGVLVRFGSGETAIAGVRELVGAIPEAGLPEAHAGLATGPFVVRDGDVYGHTVNLASRIAGRALAGDVLLPLDDASALLPAGDWTDAGEATLKGVPQPVRLARVRSGNGSEGRASRG